MRKHLTNAAYGVFDYASYPMGMLVVAPIVLHRLGASEYGLWMAATAVISAGGIVASGFCDANIQRVARHRGTGDLELMPHTVRSILGINLVLGAALAIGGWVVAPIAASHMAVAHFTPPRECLLCLRIASLAILLRAIESVGISTQRAFEAYRGTVQISAICRFLTLGSAAVLALMGQRIASILLATSFFLALGAFLQLRRLRIFLGATSLWPSFQPSETRVLLGLGVFAWLQALGGIVFGQLDRILLSIYLGTLAVAPYSLCVQFAQPLIGVSASGLNFLFPYLSGRAGTISNNELKRTIWKAFACNLALVAAGGGLLLLLGDRLIRLWAGASVAQSADGILAPIVLGSALMGLGATGTYAMQALGRFQTVAYISLVGRTAMLLLMIYLLHRRGLEGLAISRLCYGVAALLVYLPLLRQLNVKNSEDSRVSQLPIPCGVQEGSNP
jgi:O-antigen/teichoic acid export membrane protein